MKKLAKGFFTTAKSATFALLFVAVSVWIIMIANGYHINVGSGSITQTGLITLNGSVSNSATVWLDGKDISKGLTTIRGLSSGLYEVKITAPNYQEWRKTFHVVAGQANTSEHIDLFLVTPTLVSTTPPSLSAVPLIDSSLQVVGSELFQNVKNDSQLITRFSQPILSATRSNDQDHVFLQIGNTVYVTELLGENTTKLLTLSDATPTPLLPKQNDSQLTLQNGGVTQTWQIR